MKPNNINRPVYNRFIEKILVYAAATILITIICAPLTASSVANEDGHISRSLLWPGSIAWEPHSSNPEDDIGWLGWYDSNSRYDVCLFNIWGIKLGLESYYGTMRIATNEPGRNILTLSETGVNGGCPFDSTASQNQFIGTSKFNILTGFEVTQGHIICLRTFAICNPIWNSSHWNMYICREYDGTETGDNNVNKIEFGGGDILGIHMAPAPLNVFVPTVGSSQVVRGCTYGVDYGVEGYDASPLTRVLGGSSGSVLPVLYGITTDRNYWGQDTYLGNPPLLTFNEENPAGNTYISNSGILIRDLVPPGSGTTYVVSCFSIEYYYLAPPSTLETRLALSHDYFLVLDIDDPASWAPALAYHSSAPGGPASNEYPITPNSVVGQGLYDLSGSNGCPSDMNTTLPALADRDNSDPLVKV